MTFLSTGFGITKPSSLVAQARLDPLSRDGCPCHAMFFRVSQTIAATAGEVESHQNRTIAIASDFHVDGAKSPEVPQKAGVSGSDIATQNHKSLATFHRTLKSQCQVPETLAISGVRNGHRNRKSQKSLRFRCAKCKRRGIAFYLSVFRISGSRAYRTRLDRELQDIGPLSSQSCLAAPTFYYVELSKVRWRILGSSV